MPRAYLMRLERISILLTFAGFGVAVSDIFWMKDAQGVLEFMSNWKNLFPVLMGSGAALWVSLRQGRQAARRIERSTLSQPIFEGLKLALQVLLTGSFVESFINFMINVQQTAVRSNFRLIEYFLMPAVLIFFVGAIPAAILGLFYGLLAMAGDDS